ncbi:MAG: sulfotransferase family protein [Verrucomicrobia bacterium]|nr:MAG: sulfotransferase family protein [Verrucomicrobiota bacterium]
MPQDKIVRIAMWSGPRNISTAMMRAWENRQDTFVVDEPFYAYYLKTTGKEHPGAEEAIAAGETDWRKVVAQLTGPISKDKRIFFQKQMTHHLLPEVDWQWLDAVTNCFLIRDPREVIASYIKKRENSALEDLGYVQQAEIFDFVRTRVKSLPPILDAKDVLENPGRMLRLLCKEVGVEFSESMLSWPPGLRETDGVWGKYWYGEVAKTTSFRPYRPRHDEVPEGLSKIYERCRECYDRLCEYRLR